MVHTGDAWPYSACRSGSGLNEGLGRNRGDACLEGRTTVPPKRCDVALRLDATSPSEAGVPERLTLPAVDEGKRKRLSRNQHLTA